MKSVRGGCWRSPRCRAKPDSITGSRMTQAQRVTDVHHTPADPFEIKAFISRISRIESGRSMPGSNVIELRTGPLVLAVAPGACGAVTRLAYDDGARRVE